MKNARLTGARLNGAQDQTLDGSRPRAATGTLWPKDAKFPIRLLAFCSHWSLSSYRQYYWNWIKNGRVMDTFSKLDF